MTRITMYYLSNTDHGWIKKNHDEIKSHPAWKEKVQEAQSDILLKGKAPFTYILWGGEIEHVYYISYVKNDLSIKHQRFVLELDRKGWYYRNGVTDGLAEILSKDLEKLIPMMMHCDAMACTPLRSIDQS